MASPRSSPNRLVGLVLVAGISASVVAGCSSNKSEPGDLAVGSGPATTSSQGDREPADGERAVLRAFDRFWTALHDVITTHPVNPDDPRLDQAMGGDALRNYREGLRPAARIGGVYEGEMRYEAPDRITITSPTSAELHLCYVDTMALVDPVTGRQLQPPEPSPAERTFFLTHDGSRWRVTAVGEDVEVGCPA